MSIVSIIIPMYNCQDYIEDTLASIFQEESIPLEVIVVNDASTDGSVEKVEAINDDRIRILEGYGKGFINATNVGMAAAKGEILMRCDADDLYPQGRIVSQVQFLEKHPECDVISGGFSTIDSKGKLVANLKCGQQVEEITQELQSGAIRNHFCTYAMRSKVWQGIGGSRIELNGAADLDLQLRIGEMYRVWFSPEIYYYYRLHDSSLTHTQKNVERKFYDALVRELQKQRLEQGSDDLQRGLPLPKPPETDDQSVKTAAQHIQGMLLGRAWKEHKLGNKFEACKLGVQSILKNPSNLITWRSFVMLILKPTKK